MIKEEYKNGCRLKEQVKYNIDYDDCQILNLTCANYIYDLVQESSKYETKLEDVKKMLYMIEKLLGHEVQYDIPEYHGDNKKCYFGAVSDNFVIDENNIKQLDYVLQDSKEFVESFSTDYQKILYCYPNEFGDINSIKDQNQFEIKGSFQRNAVTIDGILYNVYILKDASTVDNYSDKNSKYYTIYMQGECNACDINLNITSNNILDSTTENINFIARGIRLDQNFSGVNNKFNINREDINLISSIRNNTLVKDIVKYIDYEDIPTLNMVANLGGVFIEYIKGKPVISGDMYVSKMGTTQERPANIINKGFQYFDTTINKPIYWDGSKWIDATGATV